MSSRTEGRVNFFNFTLGYRLEQYGVEFKRFKACLTCDTWSRCSAASIAFVQFSSAFSGSQLSQSGHSPSQHSTYILAAVNFRKNKCISKT